MCWQGNEVMARWGEDVPTEKKNRACLLSEEEWQCLQLTEKFYMMAWQVLDSFLPSSSLLLEEAEQDEGMEWELYLSCPADMSAHGQVRHQKSSKHK